MDNIRGKTIPPSPAPRTASGMPPQRHCSAIVPAWSSAIATSRYSSRRSTFPSWRGVGTSARRHRPQLVREFLDQARADGGGRSMC